MPGEVGSPLGIGAVGGVGAVGGGVGRVLHTISPRRRRADRTCEKRRERGNDFVESAVIPRTFKTTPIMVFQEQFTVSTSGHGDMHDLTERVASVVARSKVATGL